MYTKSRITGEKILKSPIKLIGAKTKVRDILYPLFPPHKIYLEPFLGSGAVLMGKPKAETEIVSDINPYMINFFKTLQKAPEDFFSEVKLELVTAEQNGRQAFDCWKYEINSLDGQDRFFEALYFYLITKHCMNGIWRLNKKGKCNSSYCGTTKGRGILTQEWLGAVAERIKDVRFFCEDWQAALGYPYETSDGPIFIFLDPPYHDCKTTYNGIRWTDKNFIELKEALEIHGANWLLTINDDPFIRDLFKGYNIIPHDVNYSCSQTAAGRGKGAELLVANYDIQSRWRGG